MHRFRLLPLAAAALLAGAPMDRATSSEATPSPGASQADTPPSETPPTDATQTIEVIGTTPLPGTGIDIDRVPGNAQTLSATILQREGSASLTRALTDQLGGVSINDNQDNPFQPDILYRGFAASPVLGTAQGLAVYQNGVRINEAFGDTVNWDLFPDIAIDRVDLQSSNPVFGLNALGGALVLTMKNGFTYQGFEGEISGGSFGRRSGLFQYGQQEGAFAAYIAGKILEEDGWRQYSSSSLQQLYADLGARGERAMLDISFTGANNRLYAVGATPVQELAINRSFVFTRPQDDFNQLEFLTANGSYQATDDLSLQANLYYREFRQTVQNGNTTNYTACTTGNGLLCQPDGTTLLTAASGAPIPDISQGGTIPIGENDREAIRSVTVGGSLQATYTGRVFGHDNNFVFGASIDHGVTDFQSSAELGIINSQLLVEPSGLFVLTPEGSQLADGTQATATPVSLHATNDYYGIFASDTFDVTPEFSVTASGRYNSAEIGLSDKLGGALDGYSRYLRFNPAIGGTYKILPSLTAYFGYSEANRAPTPGEIECSNPSQPCVLPSSLSSDPPRLKQVVSHTYETGFRGHFTVPDLVPGKFTWNAGLFRTDLFDDIYPVAVSATEAYFQNIGGTRRQGIEAALSYKDETVSAYLSYSLVDATFQSALTLPSPNNPATGGNPIQVRPGDYLPGIPMHRIKAGLDWRVTPDWTVGATLVFVSQQYFRGDESNLNPQLPGYEVVNLHSSYQITENFEIFGDIENVFNSNYATFGIYGDPTGIGTPGVPAGAVTNGPGVDNRFISPAPPIAAFAGVRVRF
jgi:iron complex outermembrane recepter protein